MLRAVTLYEEHQAQIQAVIGIIVRRHHLNPDEGEEFAGHARLRLLENDSAILRKFEGRGKPRAYLVTVIGRLFLDYRTAKWGRWRPSAAARRFGATAVHLERLTSRDRLPLDQAIAVLQTNFRVAEDEPTLLAIYARLPRTPRRTFVDQEVLADVASPGGDAQQPLHQAEKRAHAAHTWACLQRAMAGLPAQDRLILQLKFEEELTVATIARTLALEQKPLYRRIELLLSQLRRQLEADGIAGADVQEWLGDSTLSFTERPTRAGGESSGERPSL